MKEDNLEKSFLEGKAHSDSLNLIGIIPLLTEILFLISLIFIPFRIKKFLKLKKEKENSFW